MKKPCYTLLFTVIFFLSCAKQPKKLGRSVIEVNTYKNIEAVLKKSSQSNTLIVLGTTWCGPCQVIKRDLLNNNFFGGKDIHIIYYTLQKGEYQKVMKFGNILPLVVYQNMSHKREVVLENFTLSPKKVRDLMGR